VTAEVVVVVVAVAVAVVGDAAVVTS